MASSFFFGLSITWPPPFLFPFITLMGNVFFRLSQEGLFNLLDSIEGRLHGEQKSVYGDSSIDGRQLNRIIRYTPPVCLLSFTILSLPV